MRVATLASGSRGNCTLVSSGAGHILLDAGISMKRIRTGLAGLGCRPAELSGVFITHAHSDHIAGLSVLCRQWALPVYASPETARQLAACVPETAPLLRALEPGEVAQADGLLVWNFPTLHDCPGSVGYVVSGADCRFGLCTDLGCVTDEVFDALCGVQAALLEANHDIDLLCAGPYPPSLKRRILSPRGHLSNEHCADLAAQLARQGTRTVILGHLSQENNRPALALDAVGRRLPPEVRLLAAPPDRPLCVEIGGVPCWE